MSPIVNKDFVELAADGSNYLTWAMDVKITLTAKGFLNSIEEPNPQAPVSNEAKYATLHFLRHHLHPDLKNEYIMEENPRALWVALKERYDQQRQLFCPKLDVNGLSFALWISNLLQNITLSSTRFVPNFVFVINQLMMPKRLKRLCPHFSQPIGYCSSNTAATSILNTLT